MNAKKIVENLMKGRHPFDPPDAEGLDYALSRSREGARGIVVRCDELGVSERPTSPSDSRVYGAVSQGGLHIGDLFWITNDGSVFLSLGSGIHWLDVCIDPGRGIIEAWADNYPSDRCWADWGYDDAAPNGVVLQRAVRALEGFGTALANATRMVATIKGGGK